MKAAKIIATFGPACSKPETIKEMINAGLDAIRLNLAHMTPKSLTKTVEEIRSAAPDIALLADLPGMKLRLQLNHHITLQAGEEILLREENPPTIRPWPELKDVKKGMPVLLGDGGVQLECVDVSKESIRLRSKDKTTISSGVGISFPQAELSLPGLTENDLRWLNHLNRTSVDWVCVSFVRNALDIKRAKERFPKTRFFAKIERAEAVRNLETITEEADGLMVARGDLGLAVGLVEVPLLQKRILHLCLKRDKIGLVATQMLDSMRDACVPTRAEVSDVANAIMDGADGLVLTDETALGRYPVEAVKTAAEISASVGYNGPPVATNLSKDAFVADAVCDAAVRAADDLSATAIATFTSTGKTAILLSRYLPKRPIFALTDSQATARRLRIVRGVVPLLLPRFSFMEQMLKDAEEALLKEGLKRGETVVFVSGAPVGVPGRTDALFIRCLGDN